MISLLSTFLEFDFIKDWGLIAGLAGIALGVALLLFREAIQRVVLSPLSPKQSFITVIIFLVLVWSLSIYAIYSYYQENGNAYYVTVFVHGEGGNDELVLPGRGKVRLLYSDAGPVETTNDKGEATFKQIPAELFKPGVKVDVQFIDPENEPYHAAKRDTFYTLTKGKYISLAVKLYGLQMIKGVVKDFVTGVPLDSVRIRILGADTLSNRFGEYQLSIPEKLQRQFQTVRAYKDGYTPWELQNVPIQTDQELPISLKPIAHKK